jgi:cbb3-type cytochrome oxidase subunit 3
MDFSISPLFFLWLMAVAAFAFAYRAGRRHNRK